MSGVTVELTPALVRWAYRFLLGRDPENDAVVQGWCGAANLGGLRDGIMTSPEMAAVAMSGFAERGNWADNRATEEAAAACLVLGTDRVPDAAEVEALLLRHPSLRSLRRFLLSCPAIEARLPRPEGPRSRAIRLLGQEFTLKGDSRDPEFIAAPGHAPRLAALLRAAWPDGGEGRVMVEAGAGIGVTTLGLAAGAPGHAAIIAHEGSLRRAASLSENLAENGLDRVAMRAVAMGSVAGMMEREQPARLDLLRLNEAGAARTAPSLAPWLRERGTMALIRFDLAELLAEPGPGPRELLAECLAAFPHVVAFDAAHEPQPVLDEVGLNAALHRALMRPDRADEFLFCADLDWLPRYEAP
ncbi:class I SAM-dependent methyltransferase [Sediminicoccus rosea]|jgi:hypothetical protein|uniref:Uncharacterized protein n=1 Tax=Sediminicoccus rosea TaxID=1225128 RepID=A0ABZ0PKJ3_9PROT|nr:hypothetical protein [Sediminicoccus rosea]WPB86263.1 hypothetical protein R9Z33_05180 [Sediminicoccus rosea]